MTLNTRYKELLTDDESLKVVTLDNISASYYILGIGYAASLLAFIMELMVFSIQKHWKKKQRKNKIKSTSIVKEKVDKK